MADDRTIRIQIIAGGGSGGSGQKNDDGSGDTIDISGRILHPVKGLLKDIASKNKTAASVIGQTINIISQAVHSETNRYFTLREDYLSQKTLENQKVALGKVGGFLASVVGGATAGGIVGAFAGFGYWGVSEVLNIRNTESNYYQQLNAANFQTSFSQVRAGLVNNGRGTEN